MLVNEKRVAIRSKTFTVADAIEAADVKLEPGPVFSAGTHTLLGNDGPKPQLMLNGEFTQPGTVVYSGDQVKVVPVPETIERVVTKDKSVSIGGLPDVEHQLFHPGRSAVAEQKVGERSGEVVAERITQPALPAAPVTEKVMALTFDDGPDPAWTPQVLDILKAEGVHATFCMVGYLVERYPDLAKRVAAEGHTLCNHTAHHNVTLDKAPKSKVVSEVMGGADSLKNVVGVEAAFYRPPAGKLSPTVVAVAHDRGQRVLHWSVDTSDYLRPASAVIVGRVKASVGPGAVVLMHDGGGDRSQTVGALKAIIETMKGEGYGFTTPGETTPVTTAP
jgi:peptidoglycan/xylan/chitin deacetylase (PgdA/CDA1 family)